MPIAKAGDHGMNRKPFPREQMKDIVGAPCFDRVGCDRAWRKPAGKRYYSSEGPRWNSGI